MPIQECKYRFDKIKIKMSFHYIYIYIYILDRVLLNLFFLLLDFISNAEIIKFEQEYHNSNQLFLLSILEK